ncbi:MAG: hypothetical protein JWO95_1683 [Verrucomicrobiales bacterium]|nr:hypothetical protein [Verrucomicrobiales bacterium]
MKPIFLVFLWSLALGCWSFAAPAPLYTNDFQSAELDKVPDDMLVLDGAFTVKQDGANKFLELPGAPLDTFGVLFGPATNANVTATAKIFGTGKGRRFPTFGVGMNGAGGYKLKVAPSKDKLELYKGDDVIATAPFKWKSGTWTEFRLQVRMAGAGQWLVEGRAWDGSGKEPEKWDISYNEKTEPTPGRASVAGSPYSGTPIRFDDLAVTAIAAK